MCRDAHQKEDAGLVLRWVRKFIVMGVKDRTLDFSSTYWSLRVEPIITGIRTDVIRV